MTATTIAAGFRLLFDLASRSAKTQWGNQWGKLIMFYFDATKKPLFSAAGDPYGNRTRVSAVERKNRLKSMAFPHVRAPFMACNINDLAVMWERETRGGQRFARLQKWLQFVFERF